MPAGATRRRSGVARWAALTLAVATTQCTPASPVGQQADPPSIVLIVTDDQRAGTTAHMPNLKAGIAEPGVWFTEAFVPNALCCPARVSILTGDHSHTTGVWRNASAHGYEAFDDASTLATWLDAAGYRTGLFGKYLNGWSQGDPTYVPPGWDEWFAFLERCCSYYGFSASVNGVPEEFGTDRYGTSESARRAAGFITSTTDPVFVVWAPSAPHWPPVPEHDDAGTFSDLAPWRPPSYLEADVSDKPAWVRGIPVWTAEERKTVDAMRRREYESLRSVDDGIGVLLDALEATGRLEDTVLIYTSDNGVLWGEHRVEGKPFPWRASHRVPFVVRYDALESSTAGASASLVSTIDIAPTLVALAGLDARVTDGRSLVPLLTGASDRIRRRLVIEHATSGLTPAYCGARTANRLFVRYTTGEEELYDYRDDPWELRNAAGRRGLRRLVDDLRRFTRRACTPHPPGFSW